jgi:flagellar hook-basal body complex protein FliE
VLSRIDLDLSKFSAESVSAETSGKPRTPEGLGISFEDLLKESMVQVNSLGQHSDTMMKRMTTGDVDDISDVVLSVQRAEIALRLLTEVRNKLIDAYQQLARMPV